MFFTSNVVRLQRSSEAPILWYPWQEAKWRGPKAKVYFDFILEANNNNNNL